MRIYPSVKEAHSSLKLTSWDRFLTRSNMKSAPQTKITSPIYSLREKLSHTTIYYSRLITNVFCRVRLNALKTKFCKCVKCICGEQFTLYHCLFHCVKVRAFLPKCFLERQYSDDNFSELIADQAVLFDISESLVNSPVFAFL